MSSFEDAPRVAEALIANAAEELENGPQSQHVFDILTSYLAGWEDKQEGMFYLAAALAGACARTQRDLQALSAVVPSGPIPPGGYRA